MKNAKKEAHQSTHDVYNDCQIAQKKRDKKTKKILIPSIRTHLINEVKQGQ